jgi:hypothetical protein
MQAKISSEYFPQTVPNVKAKDASFRCSEALHFGRRPFIIADVMLYNIEIAFLSRKHHQTGTSFIRACSTLSSKQSFI